MRRLRGGVLLAVLIATAACADSSGAGRDSIKIASWNIEWLTRRPPDERGVPRRGESDFARLRAYARDLDADIIALQEVDGAESARLVLDPDVYRFHFTSDEENPQRTGFAWKKGLDVTPLRDAAGLAVRGIGTRRGADVLVRVGGEPLRLLSVHLKAGCREGPLDPAEKPCRILAEQVPALERWIDDRAREGVPFAVLGDFNRPLGGRDPLWRDLDDGEPPGADLDLAGAGRRPRCHEGRYRDFVDHIVLGGAARDWLLPGSFGELVYRRKDTARGTVLSDHCPIVVVLATTPSRRGS